MVRGLLGGSYYIGKLVGLQYKGSYWGYSIRGGCGQTRCSARVLHGVDLSALGAA